MSSLNFVVLFVTFVSTRLNVVKYAVITILYCQYVYTINMYHHFSQNGDAKRGYSAFRICHRKEMKFSSLIEEDVVMDQELQTVEVSLVSTFFKRNKLK